MNYSLWFGDLAAYSLQIAALVLAGTLAWGLLRVKQARLTLGFWQVLLAACLLLPLLEPWVRIGTSLTGSPGMSKTRTSMPDPGTIVPPSPHYKWVLLVLAVGIGLGLLRLVLGLWRLADYRRTARWIEDLPGPLREAQALVGAESAFFLSGRLEVPVTFGWRSPAVSFPARFEEMEESHQRAIACHELLHVARRDWLQNLVEEMVLTVFWFHPAVWWVVRNIRLSREQAVDREVVKLTGARQPYLQALLEIAKAPRALTLPAPLFLAEGQLARRVAALVKEVRMSRPRLVGSLAIAVAVIVGAGWWAAETFWLIAPGEPAVGRLEAYTSAGSPGSGVPYIFVLCCLKPGGHDIFGAGLIEGDQMKGPVPLSMPPPPYTPQAKKDKVQGAIIAEVNVDASGNVAGVKVTAVSLTHNLVDGLDQGVIDTVRTWKFKPATRKGKPAPATVHVQVNFNLS